MRHTKRPLSRRSTRAVFVWMLGITGCTVYFLFFSSAIESNIFARLLILVALGIAWLYFAKATRKWRSAWPSESFVGRASARQLRTLRAQPRPTIARADLLCCGDSRISSAILAGRHFLFHGRHAGPPADFMHRSRSPAAAVGHRGHPRRPAIRSTGDGPVE
jgi:hypothetical protein